MARLHSVSCDVGASLQTHGHFERERSGKKEANALSFPTKIECRPISINSPRFARLQLSRRTPRSPESNRSPLSKSRSSQEWRPSLSSKPPRGSSRCLVSLTYSSRDVRLTPVQIYSVLPLSPLFRMISPATSPSVSRTFSLAFYGLCD